MQRQSLPKAKSRWRTWGYRTFIIANIVGLVIAIPLLSAVIPLLRIWWNTRSQESFAKHQSLATAIRATNAPANSADQASVSAETSPATQQTLQKLTNQLELVSNLSTQEIQNIVASQFGAKKRNADPSKFDRDSAVFHSINRKVSTANGKEYYCYEVDLVDENGNHKTHIDYFEKPDMDYERSMATMALVNSNPQLKKIYDAMAHMLAEKSSIPSTNDPGAESGDASEGAKKKPAKPVR